MTDSVLGSVRPQFRALATTLLPETRTLDGSAWQRAESIIEAMLDDRPPDVRRKVGRFIRLANVLPILRYGRTFVRLSEPRRSRFIQALEEAPILAVRRGVWGLRTLVSMGYVGQDPNRDAGAATLRPQGWSSPPRARRRSRGVGTGTRE